MYYPPVGFHFRVRFAGLGGDDDMRFQSVGGLSVEFDTETIKEGGENRFEHKLPVRAKYPDLVLKRGMLVNSDVAKWCLDALKDRIIRPVQVDVTLLNEEHQPLKNWSIYGAWPRKWSVSDFNAAENAVVVESLELVYQYFTVN